MPLDSDSEPSIIASSIYDPAPTRPTPTGARATNIPDSADDNAFNDDDNDNGILNYYFLLLALLIIILGLVYLAYVRRQRQKVLQSRRNGQRALARDLERWPGSGPWGPGRFRMPRSSPRQPRREEGLDERGEAPPPYIPKEPEPAYAGPGGGSAGPGNDIPLQDLTRSDHKPPDYEEGPSSASERANAGAGPVMRHE
ncbi:MAG: hypothetical protein Q9211_006739 [Gyalolechia sp. 1 TL-2023]